MKKNILIISSLFFTALVFSLGLYFEFKGENEPFRCVAQFKQKAFFGNSLEKVINSNTMATLILTDQEHGFFQSLAVWKWMASIIIYVGLFSFLFHRAFKRELKWQLLLKKRLAWRIRHQKAFGIMELPRKNQGLMFILR
ncbi:hypothetical protein BHU62_21915 [Serratia marcescens]|uniref:Uncharacterized protein n=1 Tax=Serratia marcescens TaxID=615 RepID=A0A1Q4NUN2_SERMA|nr:hypothetical protein BHU62_21915 [Serratia marcescens]